MVVTMRLAAVAAVLCGTAALAADPSPDALAELGRRIESAVRDRQHEAVDACLDAAAFAERALQGSSVPAEWAAAFRAAMGGFAPGKRLCEAVGDKGDFRHLPLAEAEQRPSLVFRLVGFDGTLDCYEFLIAADGQGRLRAVDVFRRMTGEWLSAEALREHVLRAAAKAPPPGEFSGPAKRLIGFAPAVADMRQKADKGAYEEALDAFAKSPDALRGEAFLLRERLAWAACAGRQALAQAAAEAEARLPQGLTRDLALYDAWHRRKDFAEAGRALDRLAARLPDDPAIPYLRARLRFEDLDLKAVRDILDALVRHHPGMKPTHWLLVDIAVFEGDYEEACRRLTVIEQEFHVKQSDLKADPLYSALVVSAAFEEWSKGKPAANP
jgi:hypothetical protein